MSEESEIVAKLFGYGGGEEEPINLDAYLNNSGLITLCIDEERWIELSPIHAKKLREKLDAAIGESLAQYLSPTK